MSEENLVKQNLEQKTTDELIEIWTENDKAQWAPKTFKIIREILEERSIPIPEQKEDNPADRFSKIRFPSPHKGINRFVFLLSLLAAVSIFFSLPTSSKDAAGALLLIILFFPVYFRYRSIGYKRAWVYGLFATFPIVFLWIWARGFYQQKNYLYEGSLDKAGKIVLPIYWVTIAMILITISVNI
jgi:hypothetical protein